MGSARIADRRTRIAEIHQLSSGRSDYHWVLEADIKACYCLEVLASKSFWVGITIRARLRIIQMLVKYFAYGSNMASEVITRVCPRHRFLGVARLDDHRLAFTRRSVRTGTGVADVIPAKSESVFGVLYAVDDDELAALDRKEGYDWAYTRTTRPVALEAGGPDQMAVVYTVRVRELAEVRPSRQYLDRLIAAAYERGLPEEYVEKLEATIAS